MHIKARFTLLDESHSHRLCEIPHVRHTYTFSFKSIPEKVWSSNDHVLEILKGQTPIVVQVGLVDDLVADHPHLVLRQLVTRQFVQRLLQV